MIVVLPEPVEPTKAVVWPAGKVSAISERTSLLLAYLKLTPSNCKSARASSSDTCIDPARIVGFKSSKSRMRCVEDIAR